MKRFFWVSLRLKGTPPSDSLGSSKRIFSVLVKWDKFCQGKSSNGTSNEEGVWYRCSSFTSWAFLTFPSSSRVTFPFYVNPIIAIYIFLLILKSIREYYISRRSIVIPCRMHCCPSIPDLWSGVFFCCPFAPHSFLIEFGSYRMIHHICRKLFVWK